MSDTSSESGSDGGWDADFSLNVDSQLIPGAGASQFSAEEIARARAPRVEQVSTFEGVVRLWDPVSRTGYISCAGLDEDIFLCGLLNPVSLDFVPGELVTFSILCNGAGGGSGFSATGLRRAVVPSSPHPATPAGKRARAASVDGTNGESANNAAAVILEALRATSPTMLIEHVVKHFERTSMDTIASFGTTALYEAQGARAARRRQFSDCIAHHREAPAFVAWMFQQMMAPAPAIHATAAADNDALARRSEQRATDAHYRLLLAEDTMTRFCKLLDAFGISVTDMPEAERRMLLFNVFLGLRQFRVEQIESVVSRLEPFQQTFVVSGDEGKMSVEGAAKFQYIIGWLVFKLRCRTSAGEGNAAAREFVRMLVKEEITNCDHVRERRDVHIVPVAVAVTFGTSVKRLVYYMLDKYIEMLGPALLHHVKASVMVNYHILDSWTKLVTFTGVALSVEQERGLLLLWVQYYMKSRQKEYVREKGWQPTPQPTLRAALRGAGSVHADRDLPKPSRSKAHKPEKQALARDTRAGVLGDDVLRRRIDAVRTEGPGSALADAAASAAPAVALGHARGGTSTQRGSKSAGAQRAPPLGSERRFGHTTVTALAAEPVRQPGLPTPGHGAAGVHEPVTPSPLRSGPLQSSVQRAGGVPLRFFDDLPSRAPLPSTPSHSQAASATATTTTVSPSYHQHRRTTAPL